jgi:hypothetical protein
MGRCSKESDNLKKSVFIDRINNAKLALGDINIFNMEKLIAYFGKDRCKEINNLDLISFTTLNDKDIENIVIFFPHLKHLSISNESDITNDSTKHIEKLTELESFKCVGKGHAAFTNLPKIIDFRFLKNLKKLTSLEISEFPIINLDLSFFKECKNLTTLSLKNCSFTDLSFLKHLDNLTSLILWNIGSGIGFNNNNNSYFTIPAIFDNNLMAVFKNLKTLSLRTLASDKTTDYKFLQYYKNLEILEIINATDHWNLSLLKEHENLQILCLPDTPIPNNVTALLKQPHKLTQLHIALQQDSDINFLINFPNLSNLHLLKYEGQGLNVLKHRHFPQLRSLSISSSENRNQHFNVDLSFLKNLKDLESLIISCKMSQLTIQKIESLKYCKNLARLQLNSCNQIEELPVLENLKELHLIETVIKKTLSLKKFANIQKFISEYSDITNFNFLEHLKELRVLRLRGQKSTLKTTLLENLEKLRDLNLYESGIYKRDIKPLTKLTKLQKLDLSFARFDKLKKSSSSFKNLTHSRGLFLDTEKTEQRLNATAHKNESLS